MNNILKGRWNQVQGQIKQTWGKLTDDDIAKTEGDVDQLVGLIQERYGVAAAHAKQQLAEFVQSVKDSTGTETSTPDGTEPLSHRRVS